MMHPVPFPEVRVGNTMRVVACAVAVLATGSLGAGESAGAPAAEDLTALVKEFLAGVSRNDAAVHDRFWADDLVYTRAAGERVGKADILRDVRATPKANEPTMKYA